jgi:hypothetical protein
MAITTAAVTTGSAVTTTALRRTNFHIIEHPQIGCLVRARFYPRKPPVETSPGIPGRIFVID